MQEHVVFTDSSFDQVSVFHILNQVTKVFDQPELKPFLMPCMALTVPTNDGTPYLIRLKADAIKLGAGLAEVRGSKSYEKEKALQSKKGSPGKASAKKGPGKAKAKAAGAGHPDAASMATTTSTGRPTTFYDDILAVANKATEGADELKPNIIEAALILGTTFIVNGCVQAPKYPSRWPCDASVELKDLRQYTKVRKYLKLMVESNHSYSVPRPLEDPDEEEADPENQVDAPSGYVQAKLDELIKSASAYPGVHATTRELIDTLGANLYNPNMKQVRRMHKRLSGAISGLWSCLLDDDSMMMEEIASAPDLSQRMEIFMKFLGGYVFEAWPGIVAFYALHVYEAIGQG